ncbi:C-type Lectin CRL-like [Oreochromis aureus]|uniref:C-type Lectin CRL-like n=1 Tax=Oreochromis aureus TaxID=47969 RepID=UPI001953446E|nr:C-type Lectin CRL-like [Oreochromis aureus]
MEKMAKVLETVKDQYDSAVWIGLWRGNTFKWHWSLADKEFYKEGERNYFIWSFLNDNFNCGSYKYGTLRANNCGNSIYFICFDETQQGKDQYILITQSKAWIAARDYCRTHYTDLTSLRNDAEYQVIQEVASGFEVWVGLFRDPWEWSDQSDSSFRYWKANKPVWTESCSCGALVKLESGRWDELACEDTYPFLCDCNEAATKE